jgi:hypothetical protein
MNSDLPIKMLEDEGDDYVDSAHLSLVHMQTPTGGGMLSQYPLGFGQWLQALVMFFESRGRLPLSVILTLLTH